MVCVFSLNNKEYNILHIKLQIRPFEMPVRLNGNIYNNFVSNNLPELLEDVPLNIRQQLIFQQDDAPPQNAIVCAKV